jgi:hypothetical protein
VVVQIIYRESKHRRTKIGECTSGSMMKFTREAIKVEALERYCQKKCREHINQIEQEVLSLAESHPSKVKSATHQESPCLISEVNDVFHLCNLQRKLIIRSVIHPDT